MYFFLYIQQHTAVLMREKLSVFMEFLQMKRRMGIYREKWKGYTVYVLKKRTAEWDLRTRRRRIRI